MELVLLLADELRFFPFPSPVFLIEFDMLFNLLSGVVNLNTVRLDTYWGQSAVDDLLHHV